MLGYNNKDYINKGEWKIPNHQPGRGFARGRLEVLLVVDELNLGLDIGVLTAARVQLLRNDRGSAEENTDLLALELNLLSSKDAIKIGTTKNGARVETSERVSSIGVAGLLGLGNLASKEKLDGQELASPLKINEEIQEPLKASLLTVNPEEIHTFGLEVSLLARVVDIVADVLEDRGHRGNSDTGRPQHSVRKLVAILRSGSEGAVDEQNGRTVGSVNHVLLNNTVVLLVRVHESVELTGPITSQTDVAGDEILIGGRGDGEWMPLIVGNVGASHKDVLARAVVERGLLHAQLENTRRVRDGLDDDTALFSTEHSNSTLNRIQDERADSPDPKVGRLQNTVHSVSNQTGVENDEHVVSVPEGLEAGLANGVHSRRIHQAHRGAHDESSSTGSTLETKRPDSGPGLRVGGNEAGIAQSYDRGGGEPVEIDKVRNTGKKMKYLAILGLFN